jgi:plastocyanin
MNNKKRITIFVLVVLLIVILLAIFWFKKRNDDSFIQDQYNALSAMKDNSESSENILEEDDEMLIPGANIINSEQIVVNDLGSPVQVDVMPNAPEAPKAVEIAKKDLKNLGVEVVEIKVANNRFSPDSFVVSSGAPVSLAISSNDKKTHVITFTDSSLAALAFGVPAGKTKAMTFNAPLEPGRYEFKCDVPGHKDAGEIGYMIVE